MENGLKICPVRPTPGYVPWLPSSVHTCTGDTPVINARRQIQKTGRNGLNGYQQKHHNSQCDIEPDNRSLINGYTDRHSNDPVDDDDDDDEEEEEDINSKVNCRLECGGRSLDEGPAADAGICRCSRRDVDSRKHHICALRCSTCRTTLDRLSCRTERTNIAKMVLVAVKFIDDDVIQPLLLLLEYLVQEKHATALIDENIACHPDIKSQLRFIKLMDQLLIFSPEDDQLTTNIDAVITLGTDGCLLYASSLFQKNCPPVLAFHVGEIGFLSSLEFKSFKETINSVIEERDINILERTRLECIISRKQSTTCITDSVHAPDLKLHSLVLNEVVVDRGVIPFLCHLDVYINDHHVTSVQGDGLILSSPTGSTAYAAAAGSSMVHPGVPAIVILPVCAHSLSFRPIIVPAGVVIKVMNSPVARSEAWVSLDGQRRVQLRKDECLTVTTSSYSLPVVTDSQPDTDWFNNLAQCLHWNVRKPQKPLAH